MIVSEPLQLPDESKRFLRLTTEELFKDYALHIYHMRNCGDGLVTAEGEQIECDCPTQYTKFDAVRGELFGYDPAAKRLKAFYSEDGYSLSREPIQFFRSFDKSGNVQLFALTEFSLALLADDGAEINTASGGVCAAVFHERVFTAKGRRLNYSAAFEGMNFAAARYGGGYIEFSSDAAGDIRGMVPYKEKLYLLHQNGISALRVLGDELNFKITYMPMKCGNMIAGSAAVCGERIAYFTDGGLNLFNGAVSVLAEHSRFEEIELTRPVKARTYAGRYYALLYKKTGGKVMYCYDPETNEGHFIENGATDFGVGEAVFFVRGDGYVYRMTERGACRGITPYCTVEHLAFGLGEEKMLRAIAIEGEGEFSVSVTSGRGNRSVSGGAWETLKLRSPLRGSGFNLKISLSGENADSAKVKAIRLYFTEEKDDN